jgi:hypothetical protein
MYLNRRKAVGLAILLSLFVVGCGSSSSSSAPSELADPRWRLTSAKTAQGASIAALESEEAGQVDLFLIDKYMTWTNGCNGVSGTYEVDGPSLRITGPNRLPVPAVPAIECTPAQARVEAAVRQSFYSEMTWSVASTSSGSTLTLTSLQDGSVAMFVATPR